MGFSTMDDGSGCAQSANHLERRHGQHDAAIVSCVCVRIAIPVPDIPASETVQKFIDAGHARAIDAAALSGTSMRL